MSIESISNLSPIFEEMLSSGKEITFSPGGISMKPLIYPGTRVVIEPLTRPLARHDIILYKRNDGSLVLHRIVKIKGDRLTMCGDGEMKCEKGIKTSQVLGILKGFYHSDKLIIPQSKKYRNYCNTLFLRRIKRRAWSIFKKK